MPLQCWARLQRERTGEEEAGRITAHCVDPAHIPLIPGEGRGGRMSTLGVHVDGGGEASVQPARRQVGVHLSDHPGAEWGEGDRDGDTRPWWEGPLWTAPQETQSGHSRGHRGCTTPPATRPTLGVHEFASSIPDATRDTPCWAGTHQWPRHEIMCVPGCVSVHRGTEAAMGLCVGTQGVSGCVCMAECACGQWPCTQAQMCMQVWGRGSKGALDVGVHTWLQVCARW